MGRSVEYRTFDTYPNDDGPDFSSDVLQSHATHVHSERIRNNPHFSARDYLIPKHLVDGGAKDMTWWGDFEGKTRSDVFEQLHIYQDQTFSLLKHTDIDRSHLWTPYGGRFEQQYGLFDDLEDQHVSLAKRMNYQWKSAIIDNYG